MKQAVDEDIFDYIVETEDELNAKLQKTLYNRVKSEYGESGLKVLGRYVKDAYGGTEISALEKYIDSDETLENEECSECVERAQKVAELTELFNQLVDVQLDNTVDVISRKFNFLEIINKIISILDPIIKTTLDGLCYTINKDLKYKLILRIILEVFKKVIQKDDNNT